jgi:hypothetical protein
MPGAVAVFFPQHGTLYTGDIAPSRATYQLLKYLAPYTRRMYVDYTFNHPSLCFASFQQSVWNLISEVQTTGLVALVMSHTGSLMLYDQLPEFRAGHFILDSSLSDYMRTCTLLYRQPAGSPKFVLVDPRQYKGSELKLVIPSSLWFIKTKQTRHVVRVGNLIHLQFTSHLDWCFLTKIRLLYPSVQGTPDTVDRASRFISDSSDE